jgi:hypothetical protein
MDNLEQITYKSVMNYFKALSLYGFKSSSDTKKLIILAFIQDFVSHFKGMFTKEDTMILEKAVMCLTDSTCLIEGTLTQQDYYSYSYNIYSSASLRVSEDLVARIAEESGIRVVE